MKTGNFRCAASITAALLSFCGTAAIAQPVSSGPPIPAETVFDGDYATVGLGVSYGASYDGSDDYTVSVLPVVTGSLGGVEFTPRGPGLAFDIIPDNDGDKIDFIFGPVVTASFDRVNNIEDPVVEQLGDLDLAIEVGPTAGLQVNRVLNPFDSLTAAVDVKWDIAGAHNGMVVSPSLTYFTPLSRGVAVSLAFTAEHVDDDYARYYYSISPAGNAASGLPVFNAEGGWKSVGATMLAGFDLDGDVTNGGFGIFAIGGYSRLLNDAKRSPVTSIRGDADQWFGALGLGYTF